VFALTTVSGNSYHSVLETRVCA